MIDPYSKTWKIVKDQCEKSIENARMCLEQSGCDTRRADYLRGQIATIKEILELEKAASADGMPLT